MATGDPVTTTAPDYRTTAPDEISATADAERSGAAPGGGCLTVELVNDLRDPGA